MKTVKLFFLLLFPIIGLAQPTAGTWTTAAYVTNSALNGITVTVDSGSNRALVFIVQTDFGSAFNTTTITIGGVAPTVTDEQTQGSSEFLMNYMAVWNEAAIASMSGSTLSWANAQNDDMRVSYVTLQGVNQTALGTLAFTGETDQTAVSSFSVTTSATATDYMCVFAGGETAATAQFSGWDTLTERWDENTNNGGRVGGACGNGGDSSTLVSLAGSQDAIGAALIFPVASSPIAFSSGPTVAAAANGFTISGTITNENGTVYAVAVNPGAAVPSCTQIRAGTDGSGVAAAIAASEAWTADAADSFALTEAGAWARYDVHVCGYDGTTDATAVTSSNDTNRTADTGQAITVLTSVAATSIFTPQTVTGCDTDGSTAVLTGCSGTEWLQPGMIVDVSAGFAALGDIIVDEVTSTTITLEQVSNSAQVNISVTENAYFSPSVATGDVIEGDSFLSLGDTGAHDGSANAATLTDSTEDWTVDALIGSKVQNTTDGSECVITDNTATTIVCTLAGGTDNDWDVDDSYLVLAAITVAADGTLSWNSNCEGCYQKWDYNIQDVSDASNGDFDSGPPSWATGDDTVYFYNTRAEFEVADLSPLLFYVGVAASVDLSNNCLDPDGAAVTFIDPAATVPSGTTLSSAGLLSGTPDTEDETAAYLLPICVDEGGLRTRGIIEYYVTDDAVTMPTITDSDITAAITDMTTARPWLDSSQISFTFACGAEADDQILTQSVAPAATIDATEVVSATVAKASLCSAAGSVRPRITISGARMPGL